MYHDSIALLESAFERLTMKPSLVMAYARDAALVGLRSWMELNHIPKGSEIIVSGLDNDGAIQACLHLELTPIIADVDRDTLQPTLDTIKATKAVNPLAIMVRHYGGYPCLMDDLFSWCKARRITLINDASDCLPSKYKSWPNASWPADITFFRFLGCSVLSMRDLRIFEIAKTHRSAVTEQQAKIALDEIHDMQLRYDRRRQVWDIYMRAFEDIDCLELPWDDSKTIKQACSRYPLRVQSRQADIAHEVVGTGTTSMPTPMRPMFMTSLWEGVRPDLPALTDYLDRGITLPLNITDGDAKKVVEAVKSVVL